MSEIKIGDRVILNCSNHGPEMVYDGLLKHGECFGHRCIYYEHNQFQDIEFNSLSSLRKVETTD